MVNFDNTTKENMKVCNPNWLQSTGHSYRLLIIRGSGSTKAHSLVNLLSH